MNEDSIVVVTNQYDPHADVVITELNRRSKNVIRLNTEDFPTKINFTFDSEVDMAEFVLPMSRVICFDSVKSIWYRRPEPCIVDPKVVDMSMRSFAQRESQAVLDSFYESFSGFWMSHPLKIRAASRKIYQLRLAKSLGLIVPPTLVTNNPERARDFYQNHKEEVIVKVLGPPVVETEGGFYSFSTVVVEEKDLVNLDYVRFAPTLLQAYIPKKFEFRITVVGSKLFICEIHSQDSEKSRIDWRLFDPENPIPHKQGKLPWEIERKIVKMVKLLGLSFAAIDMIVTPENEHVFLEINPNGQWAWIEELTGMPIAKAIADLLVRGGELG
ncbi:MAG: hypothetical protein UX26_C0006G0002 [Parcubacteria group bacterium GW2011_GWC1_45_9]|uniref:ATP-grasp domain-containing protein n=1 Tax=Candidatus Woesebacteria bacterium GW2011_GWB1_39_12 TaxID=1618574 RepID=A0A0G0M6L6_9BACT|nr:MAG: hypothetical protein UT24_C0032G0002 [Candidatus Woesebacteria bacterium GW2011_GWB1_39_12]KKU17153.1 MAG: hypothetical protein UX26_C0006G0002 [Parcubacteria group bacterium GW2011_GWC1_45_9]HCI05608.1 hypothetical protein [Patescibacteria group bacterium]